MEDYEIQNIFFSLQSRDVIRLDNVCQLHARAGTEKRITVCLQWNRGG